MDRLIPVPSRSLVMGEDISVVRKLSPLVAEDEASSGGRSCRFPGRFFYGRPRPENWYWCTPTAAKKRKMNAENIVKSTPPPQKNEDYFTRHTPARQEMITIWEMHAKLQYLAKMSCLDWTSNFPLLVTLWSQGTEKIMQKEYFEFKYRHRPNHGTIKGELEAQTHRFGTVALVS